MSDPTPAAVTLSEEERDSLCDAVMDYQHGHGMTAPERFDKYITRAVKRIITAREAAVRARLTAAERDRDLAESQANNLAEDVIVLERERDRLIAILAELGFCPKDGEPMPCMTCGAGL